MTAPVDGPGDPGGLTAGVIRDLKPELLRALVVLAAPHWVPASALFLQFRDSVLPSVHELLRRRLVEVLPSGDLAVPGAVREQLLAIPEARAWVEADSTYHQAAFLRRPTRAEDVIEGLYAGLPSNPAGAGGALFRYALTLSAEPYFAHDLTARLVSVWQEAERRWGLGPAAAYLRLAELLDPGRRLTPEEEVDRLEELNSADDLLNAQVQWRLGRALTVLNETERAAQALLVALADFKALEDIVGEADALRSLARLCVKTDRFNEGAEFATRSLELSEQAERPIAVAQSLQILADIDMYRGSLHASAERFRAAIEMLSQGGGRTAEANARLAYSQLLLATGDLEAADSEVRAAEAFYDLIDQKLGRANALKARGAIAFERGDVAGAWELNRAAADIYDDLGATTGVAGSQLNLARALIARGEFQDSLALLAEARATYEAARDQFGQALCLRETGIVALRRQDEAQARELVLESAAVFDSIGASGQADISWLFAGEAGWQGDVEGPRNRLVAEGVAPSSAYPEIGHLLRAGIIEDGVAIADAGSFDHEPPAAEAGDDEPW